MPTKRTPYLALTLILLLPLLAACSRKDAWVDKMVDEYKDAPHASYPPNQTQDAIAITQRYFPTGMNRRDALHKLEALNAHGFLVQKKRATVRTNSYGENSYKQYNETPQEKAERDRYDGPSQRGYVYQAYLRTNTNWYYRNRESALVIRYVVADNSDRISHVEGGISWGYERRSKTELVCGYGDWSLVFRRPHPSPFDC